MPPSEPTPASTLQQINASTPNNHTCNRCGRFDAIEFGEHWLCPDCITEAGCACAEREDLEDDLSQSHKKQG